jgi:hypothetical protein
MRGAPIETIFVFHTVGIALSRHRHLAPSSNIAAFTHLVLRALVAVEAREF